MDDDDSSEVWWIRGAQVWAWVICVVGGVGNFVTIATIFHQLHLCRSKRSYYGRDLKYGENGHALRPRSQGPSIKLAGDTILLLHLSICDFLYCVVNLPITAWSYNVSADHAPGKGFCTVVAAFRYLNALVEWMTLGLLTVQRCVDLRRSRRVRFFKPLPTCGILLLCWLGGLAVMLGALIQGNFEYNTDGFKCDMQEGNSKLYFHTLETLLPCCLMVVGCCSIIIQIWKNKRKLRASGMHPALVEKRSRDAWRSTALLLGLLLLFLVCVIPNAVYNVISFYPELVNSAVGVGIYAFYWTQYGVNFLVYAASNKNYRRAYVHLFSRASETLRRCFGRDDLIHDHRGVVEPRISTIFAVGIPKDFSDISGHREGLSGPPVSYEELGGRHERSVSESLPANGVDVPDVHLLGRPRSSPSLSSFASTCASVDTVESYLSHMS
ncbi:protein trapped in endoderm-1-like [Penaeus chinensis]|uniref:protein trapped in endoderm-1-like n=1 Tax=Penaeus chinensis TaxID=139456 RepID=UPI001FB5BDA7|nr:protein trapped in endoderm-1-like [Penaeus chinensis]